MSACAYLAPVNKFGDRIEEFLCGHNVQGPSVSQTLQVARDLDLAQHESLAIMIDEDRLSYGLLR